jgi:hypothetical protein
VVTCVRTDTRRLTGASEAAPDVSIPGPDTQPQQPASAHPGPFLASGAWVDTKQAWMDTEQAWTGHVFLLDSTAYCTVPAHLLELLLVVLGGPHGGLHTSSNTQTGGACGGGHHSCGTAPGHDLMPHLHMERTLHESSLLMRSPTCFARYTACICIHRNGCNKHDAVRAMWKAFTTSPY